MPIDPGTRFGPYEILAPIGAGGMGEVYRARDTRLDRVVAIKVLPPQLGRDPEFRARFEREAKSISALNHPHICTLHDVGREGDVEYLVMEHLEGEPLSARLAKGPIPSAEALDYAVQIADALDRAHRFGIVHRDLKPGNIFLVKGSTASGPGVCKLLDFGLAKVGPLTSSGIVETKLMTTPPDQAPLTARGSILGTFQYMAPEQIEGRDADARSDIWAFGCVLYEMLTGRRAFEGKSQASLIAAILERQPAPITELQPMTPPALGRIVRTCLEKDPDDRFHTAHDLCLHLQWIEEGGSAAGLPAPVIAGRRRHERTMYIAFALGAVILASAGVWALKPAPEPDAVISRFSFELPDDQRFSRGGRRNVAVSPDGRQFAYIANEQIYLRRMNELHAQPIRGTNLDPVEIEFSPDGEWIAFFTPPTMRGPLANATLRKIAVTGGVPVPLVSNVDSPYGLRWQGDTLVFGAGGREFKTVPSSGGQATSILKVEPSAPEQISQPSLVNNGREVLFTVRATAALWNDGSIAVQPVGGGARRVLVHGGTDGRLSPSGDVLFYAREATLFRQPVDAKTLAPVGGPTPVLENLRQNNTTGTAQYAIAANGTLVFSSGSDDTTSRLVWVDRRGEEEMISAPSRLYNTPRISSDGTKILVDARDDEQDVWIWDVVRKTMTKLTSGGDRDEYPAWSLDGKAVFYRSNPGGQPDLFRRSIDGTGAVEQITRSPQAESLLMVVPPRGEQLLVRAGLPQLAAFLTLVPLKNAPETLNPLFTPIEPQPIGEVSPDGRWLAYHSREGSTEDQVHVRPFPDVNSGHWQVSVDGGSMPMWSRTGRELYFRGRRSERLLVVTVTPAAAGKPFTYGTPETLFDITRYSTGLFSRAFDITPDGKRFVMIRRDNQDATQEIVVVSHWLRELSAKAGGSR